MNGLSPLEERFGLSEARMRQRAAENAALIVHARRMGAAKTVRKAGAGGNRLMIYDARLNLLGTIDISGMSEGLVTEIERAAVASPSTYQRQAINSPQPVRKAGKKAPMRVLYDKDRNLVAYAVPSDVRTVARSGDVARYFDERGAAVFANPKDVIEFASPTIGVKPKPAPPNGDAPTPEAVQKANRIVNNRLATREQIRWAVDVINRHSVRKSASAPAPARTGYVFRDGGIYLGGKLIKLARRNADGSMVYSL